MTARAIAVDSGGPSVLHIDVAGTLAQVAVEPLGPMPHPEDAMELQLLQAAKDCAAGKEQLPRRELVAAALREVERQEWWRDLAESKVEELRAELETLKRERAADLALHHEQRRKLLTLHFELVAFVAHHLDCLPSSGVVMAQVRALGSGYLRHEVDGAAADAIAFQVGHRV